MFFIVPYRHQGILLCQFVLIFSHLAEIWGYDILALTYWDKFSKSRFIRFTKVSNELCKWEWLASVQCKQNKCRWPTPDPPFTNLTNGTARCSLTLKKYKIVFKKDYLTIIFLLMAIWDLYFKQVLKYVRLRKQ